MHERASAVRDELHAVANRVGRLLETPGAPLAPIEIPSPRIGPGSSPVATGASVRLEAERLARLVEGLSPEQWQTEGRIADSTITIEELVARPLHTSHRALDLHGVPLERVA
jgi:hypothetical protein